MLSGKSSEYKVLHGKFGGKQGAEAKRQKAARGRSMKARPTQSRKGVKGQLPLAGSRDSVPCGVWGNAPTVPRATSISNALNKGAGSEASLPLTLRVRRRAPKLLSPQDSVKNRKYKKSAGAFDCIRGILQFGGWRVTRRAPSSHEFAAPARESRTLPSRRPTPRRVSPAHQCPACRTRRY